MNTPHTDAQKCCERCKYLEQVNDFYGVEERCKSKNCPCHTLHTTSSNEDNWKDSFEGKLWSTAVQKCFEAPFPEVAIQHLLFRISQKHRTEIANARRDGEMNPPVGFLRQYLNETGKFEKLWTDEDILRFIRIVATNK